jgi:hypothetical protein
MNADNIATRITRFGTANIIAMIKLITTIKILLLNFTYILLKFFNPFVKCRDVFMCITKMSKTILAIYVQAFPDVLKLFTTEVTDMFLSILRLILVRNLHGLALGNLSSQ